ncbi:MAG: pinensin family lanthipeptide [Cyclobacteriaceae bacterium]
MKKKNLNLSDLKVKSFVTDLDPKSEETVKGGVVLLTTKCQTLVVECINDTFNPPCGYTYGVCAYSAHLCESDILNCDSDFGICPIEA